MTGEQDAAQGETEGTQPGQMQCHDSAPVRPPRAPNPNNDERLRPQDLAPPPSAGEPHHRADEALEIQDEKWDIWSVSSRAALMMLCQAVQSLANITGDIPPTPPASRPSSPPQAPAAYHHPIGHLAAISPLDEVPGTTPELPISPSIVPVHNLPIPPMGSPEARREDLSPIAPDVLAAAELVALQNAAISRRFYLKAAPAFPLSEYLERLHKFCPHSPGVYLAAAAYIHRLCVTDSLVPATSRTIHRLCLAAIRIAGKVLEDNKWPQERMAKVGGLTLKELQSLEVNLCFLLEFELFVQSEEVQRRMWMLQQIARQGVITAAALNHRIGVDGSGKLRPEPTTAAAAG